MGVEEGRERILIQRAGNDRSCRRDSDAARPTRLVPDSRADRLAESPTLGPMRPLRRHHYSIQMGHAAMGRHVLRNTTRC